MLVTPSILQLVSRISTSEFSIGYLTVTILHVSEGDLASTRRRSAMQLPAIYLVVIVCGEVCARSITVVVPMVVLLFADAFTTSISQHLYLLVIRLVLLIKLAMNKSRHI